MEINQILKKVADGKLDSAEAKKMIETFYVQEEEGQEVGEVSKNRSENGELSKNLKKTIDNIKENVNVEDILKASSSLLQHISDIIPGKLQQSVKDLTFNKGLQGFQSRLSMFRSSEVQDDCNVAGNEARGVTAYGFNVNDESNVVENRFSASQVTEFTLTRSDLYKSRFSVGRFCNIELLEAKMEDCDFQKSTVSDLNFEASDFLNNTFYRSTLTQTSVVRSRIAAMAFSNCSVNECEFNDCELQGITFKNCEFNECTFSDIVVERNLSTTIENKSYRGVHVSNIRSFRELVKALRAAAEEKECGPTEES